VTANLHQAKTIAPQWHSACDSMRDSIPFSVDLNLSTLQGVMRLERESLALAAGWVAEANLRIAASGAGQGMYG
jgi:hypothetical protein